MILGKYLLPTRVTFKSLKLLIILLSLTLLVTPQIYSAAIGSSTDYFELGIELNIYGDSYWSNEDISVQVKYTDGFIYDSWTTIADDNGTFSTTWETPNDYSLPDTLIIVSTGDSSGYEASTTVIISTNIFHHLKNGNLSATPKWHNGDVNSSNSCYEEGASVPYRYFVKDQDSASSHYFTIQADATKNSIHTFDYFTDYDFSEASPISVIGGACSPIAAAPPSDCSAPTGTFAFPDPTDSMNYVSVPISLTNIVNGSFTANGTQYLSFYNCVVDSVSKYFFTGTPTTIESNITIYFTVIDEGSVGFFWGGHLAEGTASTWGLGNGAGSVSGAPYHMAARNYDGGGSSSKDRSVQGVFVPSAPIVDIICPNADLDSVCQLTNATCSTTAIADIYTWTITGGTIVSGQGTNSIVYTATDTPGSTVTISLEACNNSGCSTDTYCATESINILIGDCNPCEVTLTCPPDLTISCDASIDPANTGTATYTTTGNCPNLTLTYVDSVIAGTCPQEQTIHRYWKLRDDQLNLMAACTQAINIQDSNAPIIANCPTDITVECNAVPQAPTLTATDNCDPAPVVTLNETTTPGSCANAYTITRTWTATDACGNSSTCTQIVTVQDTTNPTLSGCPADVTVSCDNIPVPASVIASDNCAGVTIDYTETNIPGNCDHSYTLNRTWTATDACGNTAICTQIVTVQDTTNPTLSGCPADVTVSCDNIPAVATVLGNDNCDNTPVVTFNETTTPGSCDNSYTITRTWTVTDACGNSSNCSQIITVQDTDGPVIANCPTDITVECNAVPQAPTLTATDNCDPAPVVTLNETTTPGSCANAYTITRTWTATDACGNSSTCTQIVTVQDTTNPTLSGCPADVTVSCDNIPAPASVIASDNCAGVTIDFSENNTPGSCVNSYILTRTWTATDACGNTASCTQIVTVQDTTAPVLTGCPPDETISCGGTTPTPATVTALDDCDGVLPVTFNETSAPNLITRTWSVTDNCGNYSECIQVITLGGDEVPPEFVETCPADTSVSCVNIPTAATLTATDNCDNAPTVTFTETTTAGNCSGNYTITRTWVASDISGNNNTCTQIIAVADTQAPQFVSCPPDITADCNNIPAPPTVTANDNCSGVTIDYSENIITGACAGSYTIERTWTATDGCNNSSSCTQLVTVSDNTPPVITDCPNDSTLQCDTNLPNLDPNAITATDDCGTVTISATRTDNNGSGCLGDPLVVTDVWTATDDCGNSSSCTRIITIEDNTPPEILECAPDLVYTCIDDVPPCDPGLVTYRDNCGYNRCFIDCDRTDNGGSGCPGDPLIYTDVFTATDLCGNTTTCSRTITVIDDVDPVITSYPSDLTFDCATEYPDCSPTDITATDNCGTVNISCNRTDNSGTTCLGDPLIITDTYTIDDGCNTVTYSRTITIEDNIAPFCVVPNDTTIVLCDAATICLPVSATDNCSSVIDCAVTSGNGSIINGEWCYDASTDETVVVDIECTDECGNTSNCSFTVNFTVNSKPIVSVIPLDPVTVCGTGDTVCAQLVIDDPDNGLSAISTIGWVDFSDSSACFIVDTSGTYCNQIIISDSCGLKDTVNYCVEVTSCQTPILTGDSTINLGLLCTPDSGYISNPVLYGGCGPFIWKVNGVICSPDTMIAYNIEACNSYSGSWLFEVTDFCGQTLSSTIAVNGTVNCPPTVSLEQLDTQTLCSLTEICIDYTTTDQDNNIDTIELTSAPIGTVINPNNICFTPDTAGTYSFMIKVTDSCGAIAIDFKTVVVNIITPVEISNASHSEFLCAPGQICVPLPQVIQGTPAKWYVDGSLTSSNEICFNASISGVFQFEVIVEDACQNQDTAIVSVDLIVNDKPELSITVLDTYEVCNFPSTICATYDIQDQYNTLTIYSQNGTVNPVTSSICLDVTEPGTYCNQVIVTDSCGLADTVSYCVEVLLQGSCICPIVTIEKTHYTIQGAYESVAVSISDLAYEIGGFNILLQYDASALSFSSAIPGNILENCGWEYFTYRYGANGNCGSNACPSGIVRITSIAEVNNGENHPTCFSPSSGELFVLSFLVSNDRTLECQYTPIRFIWYDCGDNTLSNTTGDDLYISRDVYDYDNEISITDISAPYPSWFGANVSCDVYLNDGKPDPIRCIDFVNGGIDIVCADSIDARADINLNEIGYEISDAVLFTNYFVYGLSVFDKNIEGQVAASDINADGIALSVSDLVYLIRVIVGDALPYPKLNPITTSVNYSLGTLSVTEPMGAAFIIAEGNVSPILHATQMEMKFDYNSQSDHTRILIYSMEPNKTFDGEFVSIEGNIKSIELSTYDGTPVNAKVIPTQYLLHQNYPNPFNPVTAIQYEMAKAGEYSIIIFNISGQQVAEFRGFSEAGIHEITWDASKSSSGIYLYKLQVGEFSDVKKMILLK